MENTISRKRKKYNGLDQADNFHGHGKAEDNIHVQGTSDESGNGNSKQNIKKKFEDLKEVLIRSAEKEPCPDYVPLQMVQYQPDNKNNTGFYQIREEMLQSSQNDLQPGDVFENAQEVVRDSPEYKRALTEEAKLDCLNKLANIIGVIGQPGVGKSTLTKILLSRIVSEEKLYNADYIIHINLQDFYNKTEMNLFQFLIGEEVFSSLDWMNDEEIRNEVLKLLVESESVCILLDGLDEVAVTKKDLENFNVEIYGQYLSQKFILGLLSGQILPRAKKIFTSRPGQMLGLPEKFRPRFLVQILGFTPDGINQICENLCGDKSSQVLDHIKSQPDLYSYMTIPIHCVLVINCIYTCLIIKREIPLTITEVYFLSYFCFAQTEHMRRDLNNLDIKKSSDLKKICSSAWSEIKEQCMIQGNGKRATSNSTYFTHLLIQQFFAAIHCLFFMSENNFEEAFGTKSKLCLHHTNLYMVTKFMFGLLNSKTFEMLKSIHFDVSKKTNQKLLKEYACDPHVEALRKRAPRYSPMTFLEASDFFVSSLLYERKDESLTKEVAKSFPHSIKFDLRDVLPVDVLSIFYVLKYREKPIDKLFVDKISFFENSILLFLEELERQPLRDEEVEIGEIFCASIFHAPAFKKLLDLRKKNGIKMIGCMELNGKSVKEEEEKKRNDMTFHAGKRF